MGKISNEQLCAALISHSSIKDAAKALNVSERTVYNMMGTADFVSMYASVQRKILSGAILACQSRMIDALNCVGDIMTDKAANPQIRLLAAQTIIKTATSLTELSDTLKRREKQKAKGIDLYTDSDYED